MKMTEQELLKIEDRANAATPGPWVHDTVQSESAVICGHAPGVVCEWIKGAAAFDDCAFIAHAREDVPTLVAEVKRLKLELRRTKESVKSNCCPFCHVPLHAADIREHWLKGYCPAFTPEGEVK